MPKTFSVTKGSTSGGSSNWTDTGTLLHPADSSGAEDVAVGGTSTSAPIVLKGDTTPGQAKFETTASISNPPYALVLDEATTNLIVNPRADVDTSNWSTTNTTLTRDTTSPMIGSANFKAVVTTSAVDNGVTAATMSVSASTSYVFSVWLKGNAGGEQIKLRVREVTGGSANTETVTITLSTGLRRYWLARTMAAGVSAATCEILTATAATPTFFYSGAQFEQGVRPTSYCDGSLGLGYAWTGTAHASTSTRVSGLHILSSINSASGNPFVIKPDGSLGAQNYIFRSEGDGSYSGTNRALYRFEGAKGSQLFNLGMKEAVVAIDNDVDGCCLIVDGSSVTTEPVMNIDCSSLTTGTGLSIGTPSNRAAFSGYYQRYYDKSATTNIDFGWTKNFFQVGMDAIPDRKYLWLHGGGKHNSTKTAQTGTVHTGGVSSTTITGVGTTFTAAMVGRIIRANGTDRRITAFGSSTSITVNTAVTLGSAPGYSWELYDAQYEPHMIWLEGPNGDHIYTDTADYLAGIGIDEYRRISFKQPTAVDTITWPTGQSDWYKVPHVIFKEVATAGPSANQTETSLWSSAPTLLAGTVGPLDTIRITMQGTLTAASTSTTVTLRVKLGGTTLLTTHAEAINNTGQFAWRLQAEIQMNNSTTAQKCGLWCHMNRLASGATHEIITDIETAGAVDTSSNRTIDVTIQGGTANLTATKEYGYVEIL